MNIYFNDSCLKKYNKSIWKYKYTGQNEST